MSIQSTRAGMNALLAGLSLTLIGCSPAAEPVVPIVDATPAPEPQIRQAKFRSAKSVSSVCDVDYWPETVPGFADGPGRPVTEMPPPIAGMMSVGADRPMVVTDNERVSPGYTLIETNSQQDSFLIDNNREIVATIDNSHVPGLTEILPNGNRLVVSNRWHARFAGAGGALGCLEEYSSDGKLLWQLNLSSDRYIIHHDFARMENGNILAIVWESVSTEEAISQGRDPDQVSKDGDFWYDGVIEIDPYSAEIVWEWGVRHHMVQEFDASKANYGVVADHPELFNINNFRVSLATGEISADWSHFNSIDYDEASDQILLSSNYLSELYVIDHSTTAYEAASNSGGRYDRGGDILYRWGNPENYNRGTSDDRKTFGQHDVQWIRDGLNGAGNILLFNNGRPGRPYSTVVEFTPPMNPDGTYVLNEGAAYGPEELAWEYNPEPPERFFSFFTSAAQRLPNGNTMVVQGAGAKLREITSDGEIVWEYRYTDYDVPPAIMFRANKYPPDHPGVMKLLSQGQ